MKNIHILKTDKPSALYVLGKELKLRYVKDLPIDSDIAVNQNIYITSDEEIKEGDWFVNFDLLGRLDTIYDPIHKCLKVSNSIITSFEVQVEDEFTILKSFCKKIILTTDPDLIKDGVQAIDDDFLNWFVKNPSCEEVETKVEFLQTPDNLKDGFYYKIIIPKEEPKQENCCTPIGQIKRYKDCIGCDRKPKQETLEEVAERFFPEFYRQFERMLFIEGAKWQQEQDKNKYS